MAGERDLTTVFGYDTPATVPDLLERLAEAAEHLLHDHDCDLHGWEGVERSVRQAREAAVRIRAFMAPSPPPPQGSEGEAAVVNHEVFCALPPDHKPPCIDAFGGVLGRGRATREGT